MNRNTYPFRSNANHRRLTPDKAKGVHYSVLDGKRVERPYPFLECASPTCERRVCQERAVQNRVLGLRFASRGRGLLRITLTKFVSLDTADAFIQLMRKSLRGAGFLWEDYLEVEQHWTGLLHLHALADTTAPVEIVEFLYNYEVREHLDLTEWSEFNITKTPEAKNASYLLTDAKRNMAQHLALNKGRLHRSSTKGFFKYGGAGNLREAVKAERERSKVFSEACSLLGRRRAKRLTEGLVKAEQITAVLEGFDAFNGGLVRRGLFRLRGAPPLGSASTANTNGVLVVSLGVPP
mgnify:CR=1 FL=1